ncbi:MULTISPECIES: integrase [unclassified Mesorhizobium]|uniref:integrase n=1 Tax=unclassified Mesorhizobium TaxID=325217 RepID=UPI00333D03BF
MSKTVASSLFTTREARKILELGVHWRAIDPDTHLGYRKGKRAGKRAGVWLVRWRVGKGYKQAPLGAADDIITKGTLDYKAADSAARTLVEKERTREKVIAAGPVLTVGDIVEQYVSGRDQRLLNRVGRQMRSDAGQRLRRYLLGQDGRGKQDAIPAAAISKIEFHELSEDDLFGWRDGLPRSLKGTTVRRLVNDLKAGLNRGYTLNKKRLPATVPAVIKGGLATPNADDDQAEPVARENQILSDAEVDRLIIAAKQIDAEDGWDGDLFRLIVVLARTGARFSQVVRIRVRDCQALPKPRILIPASRKGRGGHAGATLFPVDADIISMLLPATTARDPDAILLERWRSRQVPGAIRWEKSERGPWTASAEFARPWKLIVERAGLPGTIPYGLRHSSIVKCIRENLPIRLVAANHNTSIVMIEKHYSAWISDGLEDMTRAAIVRPLPQEGDSNVVRLPAAR